MLVVSIDDGHSAIKVKTNEKQIQLESKVIMGNHLLESINGGDNSDCFYTVNDVDYTVIEGLAGNSSNLNLLNTQNPTYLYSDINLILTHHALYRCGIINQDLKIVSSIPFNKYYLNGKKNEQLIEKKKQNLMKNISPQHNRIIEHYIMAEGVSGYFDLLYNEDGTINKEIQKLNEEKLIVVVDGGGATQDLTVFNSGMIDFSRSGSLNSGGINLRERIQNKLSTKYNSFPENTLSKIVLTGVSGKIDFSSEVKKEKQSLAEEVINFVTTKIGNISDIGLIYFIGGTSILLNEQYKTVFGEELVRFSNNPIFATSNGMLKYLMKALKE